MKLNFILLLGLVSTVLGSEQVLNQEIICFSNDVNYTFYIGKYNNIDYNLYINNKGNSNVRNNTVIIYHNNDKYYSNKLDKFNTITYNSTNEDDITIRIDFICGNLIDNYRDKTESKDRLFLYITKKDIEYYLNNRIIVYSHNKMDLFLNGFVYGLLIFLITLILI
jgi:hypothetical protein